MATINTVTFDRNSLELKIALNGPRRAQNINLPGVKANGAEGPWANGTTLSGVTGTASKAVVAFNDGSHLTLTLQGNTPRSFSQGRALTSTTTGHGPDEPFKVYIYIQGASAQGQDSATFAE